MSAHVSEIVGDKVVEKVDGRVVSEKDLSHVLAGYKATLNNANTSEAAKEHARERLAELDGTTSHQKDAHTTRVIAGMKAALHNDHVHDEVKVELRQRLVDMGEEGV